MTKVLMIALDGATLDLLEPWMAAGELPLLARLFAEGTGGPLRSTIPWATPTAFASFATGLNPGQHGVYDFGVLKGDDYTIFVPTNGGMVRGRSLWRLLSDAGLKSVVINMPMTYPAEAFDGFLVSGIPYPAGSPRLCHPPGLLDELRQRGWDLACNASDDLAGSYRDYFDGLVNLVRTRAEATAWLLQKHRPDFTAVHFLETDQVQHRFWQFMPGEPKYDPAGPHTHAILRLFQEVEQAMLQIMAAAGEDVTLCLMSDHGFGPTRHQVWLNNWLIQHQYLALKPTLAVHLKQWLYRLGLSPAAIRENAPERLKLAILQFFERQKGRAIAAEMEKDTAVFQKKGWLDRLTEKVTLDFYDVDWSCTRAFSTGTTAVGYVYLNVKGRDPQGIIEPGEAYQIVRAEIMSALRHWSPVGDVLPREAVWHGDKLEQAPDIVVKWAEPTTDARYFQTRISSHHLLKPVPNDYASHRPDGLFLLHGPHIPAGQYARANILDLPPTFLWLLEQPIPSYLDGRVLAHLFTHSQPVTQIEAAILAEETSSEHLTADDEASIRETLRGLGYLE